MRCSDSCTRASATATLENKALGDSSITPGRPGTVKALTGGCPATKIPDDHRNEVRCRTLSENWSDLEGETTSRNEGLNLTVSRDLNAESREPLHDLFDETTSESGPRLVVGTHVAMIGLRAEGNAASGCVEQRSFFGHCILRCTGKHPIKRCRVDRVKSSQDRAHAILDRAPDERVPQHHLVTTTPIEGAHQLLRSAGMLGKDTQQLDVHRRQTLCEILTIPKWRSVGQP